MPAISWSKWILIGPANAKSTSPRNEEFRELSSPEPVGPPTTFRRFSGGGKMAPESCWNTHRLKRDAFRFLLSLLPSRFRIGRACQDRLRARNPGYPKKVVFIQKFEEWYRKWSASRGGRKSVFLIN